MPGIPVIFIFFFPKEMLKHARRDGEIGRLTIYIYIYIYINYIYIYINTEGGREERERERGVGGGRTEAREEPAKQTDKKEDKQEEDLFPLGCEMRGDSLDMTSLLAISKTGIKFLLTL